MAGRRGQEKEEGHDKSDRCSCDSSASQLFQKRIYTTTHAYIVMLYIHTYTRIRYSMCKCTHVHYKVYRSFHMPIPLKSTLFSKKHGDQMVSPCPTMAATLYPVQEEEERKIREKKEAEEKAREMKSMERKFAYFLSDIPSLKLTANLAPENQWLEDGFPFGMAHFAGANC